MKADNRNGQPKAGTEKTPGPEIVYVREEQMIMLAEIFEERLRILEEKLFTRLRQVEDAVIRLQDLSIHLDARTWITYECLERWVKKEIEDLNGLRETTKALSEIYAERHNEQVKQYNESSSSLENPKDEDGVEQVTLG